MKELIIQMENDGNFPTGMKTVGLLIRCKDCKYAEDAVKHVYPYKCVCWKKHVIPNWFCSRGERKE